MHFGMISSFMNDDKLLNDEEPNDYLIYKMNTN